MNWIRRKVPEIPEERARASVVLPVPGTSSRRTWPPAMKEAIARSNGLPFPEEDGLDVRAEQRQQLGERFFFHGKHYLATGWRFDKNPEWYLNGTPAFPLGRRNAGHHRPRCAAP